MIRYYLLCSILLISSCTGVPFSFYLQSIQEVFPRDITINKDYFDEAKFSFAKVSINGVDRGIIVLEEIIGDHHIWISEDGIRITTLNGRIIETKGFESDFKVTEAKKIENEQTFTELLNFYNPDVYSVPFNYSLREKKSITYMKLDQFIDSTKYTFNIQSKSLGINESYVVISTNNEPIYIKQNINPKIGEIELEFFYK